MNISLTFRLEKDDSYYSLLVESKYTDNDNVNFKYNISYGGKLYSKEIFNIDKNDANRLFSDFKNLILNNIKHLNPIIENEQPQYKRGKNLYYKIDLLFQNNENIFPKLNVENLFKSIVSFLKNRNIKLYEDSPEELIRLREIIISFNDNLEINIKKSVNEKNLETQITYINNISDKFIYKINIYIKTEESKRVFMSIIYKSNYYEDIFDDIFENYDNYLNAMEYIIFDRFLDKTINPIIKNIDKIRKAISEYGFYEALTVIDELSKLSSENYKEEIKNELYQNLNSVLNEGFKLIINYFIGC